MFCISFVGRKGGIGKSTICAAIATCLAKRGHRVAIIDCDPGLDSISEFFTLRNRDNVRCVARGAATLHDIAKGFHRQGFDFCLIDIGGFDAADLRLAAAFSSLMVMPIMPAGFNFRGLMKTRAILADAAAHGVELPELRVVITKAKRNTTVLRVALDTLASSDLTAFDTILYERTDYDNAELDGMTVIDAGSNQAAGEISRLTNEILEVLS